MWYEMIAGKTPWTGKSDVLLLQNIKNYSPQFSTLFSSKTAKLIKRMLSY